MVVEGHEGKEEGERLAVSFPERGIVIGKNILAVGLTPSLFREEIALTGTGVIGGGIARATSANASGGTTGFGLSLGARFGITNDLEVHAYPLQLVFAPSSAAGYGGAGPFIEGLEGPSVGAIYRFLRGPLEVGATMDLTVLTPSGDTGVVVQPGVAARLHIGKIAALDAAVDLPITGQKGHGGVGLDIPVAFSFDIIRPLHVGANSGIAIDDFGDAGNTVAIPLGFFGGYAIPSKKGPLLDIDPFFRWPELFTPGVTGAGTDKVNAGNFQVGVEFAGFFYL